MIMIRDACLTYGEQDVFKNVSLTIAPQQRISVVGRNGAGKSTFFKVIAGLQSLDSGSVSISAGMKVAYLPQEIVLKSSKSVIDEALQTFGDVAGLEHECAQLEKELELHPSHHEALERYSLIQGKLLELDVPSLHVKAKKVLQGLGFTQERLEQKVTDLSVGWRMRLVLGKLLLSEADFYLFDEPTNHLDLVAKDWFLDFLKEADCGFLLISHDKYFLDNLCNLTFELEMGKGRLWQGNYSKYMTLKEADRAILEQKRAEQERDIKKKMEFVEKFKAKASTAKRAQSVMKQLDRVELIELPHKRKSVNFSFGPIERAGNVVFTADGVGVEYGSKKIFENISFEILRGEKVALVASNGVGKTTLFKAITGRLPLTHGTVTIGYNVKMALFEQDQDAVLSPHKTILEEVEDSCKTSEQRARVRGMLGAFLFPGDDAYKKIRVLSGGEKNRVAMVKVLLQGANVLFLDEPTNHLDLDSKEILLEALSQFDGTLFFVSHDRDFVDRLATRIIELTPHKALCFPGGYESYVYHKKQQERENDSSLGQGLREKPKSGASQSVLNKSVANVQQAQTPKLSGKEEYERRKKLRSLETRLEKVERDVALTSQEVGMLDFGSEEHAKMDTRLRELQAKRELIYEEWEALEKLING